ncbi:MAG: excinuclease ABC subunit C [Alphaproteobacteria bacterium]|nr:MAG: excinuclease ABC subunit C [Alphaproteobacteria bacterium]
MKKSSIEQAIEIIKGYVASLPLSPGVYRMISDDEDVLYVGKAKALKKRVASYTHFEKLPHRLQRMVSMTRRMEFINTHTEADALILEANLIKQYKPRFNILLRDDKSFPYILLKEDHDFPQILKHRGARTSKGAYFGPFPSAGDVNRTLFALQRAFLLRNCSDNTLKTRTRPCLQYHIKRCTAPCVGKVSREEYAQQVKGAQDFMQGKSRAVQEHLTIRMEEASNATDYEVAAGYRDRIRALTSIQAKHEMNDDLGDVDVIALIKSGDMSCIQMFFYRGGRNLGNRSYFPRHDKDESAGAVLSAFMAQFYQNKTVPKDVIVNREMDDKALLEEALSAPLPYKIRISVPKRGKYKRAADFALKNASEALKRHATLSTTRLKMRSGVADLFGLDDVPTRIEVYDNSHISGTNMVGAMIVEGEEGFQKKSYRKFNIKEAGAADDYAMMREVLSRRFKRALQEDKGAGSENWPDILLIDGGLGQLSACRGVLEDLGILDQLTLVAIAKGADRNAGREKFFMIDRDMFQLPVNDPVLHYLQCLRDEAHRFAIGSHRARRAKALVSSPLDHIDGIGAKRKKSLLLHFGSAKAIEAASIHDISQVEGISQSLARVIYNYFHEG